MGLGFARCWKCGAILDDPVVARESERLIDRGYFLLLRDVTGVTFYQMDEEDLIVVDDFETVQLPQPTPSFFSNTSDTSNVQRTRVGDNSIASTSRLRSSSRTPASAYDSSDRTTRSATAKSKPQPKLKLKLSDKAAAQAPGMSFLGQYDRELDSDDEDLAFEEQFILRMPAGDDCEKLRKMVAAREVTNDVWFKFKGARQQCRSGEL